MNQTPETFRGLSFKPLSLRVKAHIDLATPHAIFRGENAILQFWAATPDANSANEIEFRHCPRIRIGDPNDDGFYSDGIERINRSIYNLVNFPDLDFYHGFFEVFGTSIDALDRLHEGFVGNPGNVNPDPKKLRHFLFFMKDATFECFAEDYRELGLIPLSALSDESAEYT